MKRFFAVLAVFLPGMAQAEIITLKSHELPAPMGIYHQLPEVTRFNPETRKVFDFGDGNGPVPAHRHPNGGGWVADTAQVNERSFVDVNARVFGYADIRGPKITIAGNAQVFGRAMIASCARGKVWIFDNAKVYGSAIVECSDLGWVQVYGNAQVYERAHIWDGAWIYGNALVHGNANVRQTSKVYGDAEVRDNAIVRFRMAVAGSTKLAGNADVCGSILIDAPATITGPFVTDDSPAALHACGPR